MAPSHAAFMQKRKKTARIVDLAQFCDFDTKPNPNVADALFSIVSIELLPFILTGLKICGSLTFKQQKATQSVMGIIILGESFVCTKNSEKPAF